MAGLLRKARPQAGSVTFNSNGTFTLPWNVRIVTAAGYGGQGNAGTAGNSGNAGNPGSNGVAGPGGSAGNEIGRAHV